MVIEGLALVCAGLALAASVSSLLAVQAVRCFVAQPCPQGPALPATILKPLHGNAPGLQACLEATLAQRHAAPVQVLFGVGQVTDLAIPAARAAMAAYPGTEASLVQDATLRGANRKIGNLMNLELLISHEVVVIADADMRMPPHWLTTVTTTLARPGVGLVTCLYRGVPGVPGLWARLAGLGIDWHFLPNAVLGESLGKARGCYGATMALRRETLEALGGLASLKDLLADDHALGEAVRRLGLLVVVAPVVPEHMMDEANLGALWAHELRWTRTVRLLNPMGYLGLALTHPLPWALGCWLFAPEEFALWSVLLVVAVLMVRVWLAWSVDRSLGLSATLGRLLLLPLRDGLSFAIWVVGLAPGTVTWQGRRYRMRPDGSMTEA